MIDYPYIPEPIIINYEEREMGKTVIVSYPLEVPEGYELASDRPEEVDNANGLYLHSGQTFVGCFVMGRTLFKLRPIATEQTWERPEWLKDSGFNWLTNGVHGWCLWNEKPVCDGREWAGGGFNRAIDWISEEVLPSPIKSPAARIWRIVERGEG